MNKQTHTKIYAEPTQILKTSVGLVSQTTWSSDKFGEGWV